jgi:predicted unusual protein kinase regulating ubiquinone biosynthesis (AarF/ABC1/UbiB family)
MPGRHGDEERDSAIATGRLRRTADIGGQAVRAYAMKAANLTRSADARHAADERRTIEAAGQIVDVLGHMKGAAMKVGQIASFIGPDAVAAASIGQVYRGCLTDGRQVAVKVHHPGVQVRPATAAT